MNEFFRDDDGDYVQAEDYLGNGIMNGLGHRLFRGKEAEAAVNDEKCLYFQFEPGSKIQVLWDEKGFGITQNVSPVNKHYEQNDDTYMYFKIWQRGNKMYDRTVDIDAAHAVITGLELVRGDNLDGLEGHAVAVHTAEANLTTANAGGDAATIAAAKAGLNAAKSDLHAAQQAHQVLEDTTYPYQHGSRIWLDEQVQKGSDAFHSTVWGNLVTKHGALFQWQDILQHENVLSVHKFPYYITGDEERGYVNELDGSVYDYILLALPKRRFTRLQDHPCPFTPQIKKLAESLGKDENEIDQAVFCIIQHENEIDIGTDNTYHKNGFEKYILENFNKTIFYSDLLPYFRPYIRGVGYLHTAAEYVSSTNLDATPIAYVLDGYWVEDAIGGVPVGQHSLKDELILWKNDELIGDEAVKYIAVERTSGTYYSRTDMGNWPEVAAAVAAWIAKGAEVDAAEAAVTAKGAEVAAKQAEHDAAVAAGLAPEAIAILLAALIVLITAKDALIATHYTLQAEGYVLELAVTHAQYWPALDAMDDIDIEDKTKIIFFRKSDVELVGVGPWDVRINSGAWEVSADPKQLNGGIPYDGGVPYQDVGIDEEHYGLNNPDADTHPNWFEDGTERDLNNARMFFPILRTFSIEARQDTRTVDLPTLYNSLTCFNLDWVSATLRKRTKRQFPDTNRYGLYSLADQYYTIFPHLPNAAARADANGFGADWGGYKHVGDGADGIPRWVLPLDPTHNLAAIHDLGITDKRINKLCALLRSDTFRYDVSKYNYQVGEDEFLDPIIENRETFKDFKGVAQPDIPVVRCTILFEETDVPLLGFYGMSTMAPSHIYGKLDYLPPYFQDFEYIIKPKVVSNAVSVSGLDNSKVDLKILKLFDFKMESSQTFEQEDKELLRINLKWPYLEIFKHTEFDNQREIKSVTIPFVTNRGIPDYIFIRIERVFENRYNNPANFEQPQVTGVSCELPGSEGPIRSLSDLDEYALKNVTRRNSNFRADHVDNLKYVGGVLLHRKDVGNFSQFKGIELVDLFQGVFTIYFRDNITDEDGNFPKGEYTGRVIFIYGNYSLEGTNFDCNFNFRVV